MSDAFLIGTNLLPAQVNVGDGTLVPLGAIVARAHQQSGLSHDAWNDLPSGDRDTLILQAAARWRHTAPPAPEPLRYRLNPCDLARFAPLKPIGDAFATIYDWFTGDVECRCCLGMRLTLALLAAGAVGAGVGISFFVPV